MIRQRRGHIVGISSLSIDCPIICSTTYIATKFANKGFMDGLREDMSFYGFSDFIKITTAIPGFIKTNDEYFEKILSSFDENLVSANKPDFVADRIIDGVLKNLENVYVTNFEKFSSWLFNSLPRKVKTQCFKNAMPTEKRDKFIQMKLKECKLIENGEIVH